MAIGNCVCICSFTDKDILFNKTFNTIFYFFALFSNCFYCFLFHLSSFTVNDPEPSPTLTFPSYSYSFHSISISSISSKLVAPFNKYLFIFKTLSLKFFSQLNLYITAHSLHNVQTLPCYQLSNISLFSSLHPLRQ